MKKIKFKNCLVKIYPENGYIETIFDDGTKVPAFPQENSEYKEFSKKLGYTDHKRMCIEHEILHTFLCESCGLDYSPTLWAVAHKNDQNNIPVWRQYEEEDIVLKFQKFLCTGQLEEELETFGEENKLDLDNLKYKAVGLLKDIFDEQENNTI